MHYQPDNELRHPRVPGIVSNRSQDLTSKFESSFLIRTTTEIFMSCCTFIITIKLIQVLRNPLSRSQVGTRTLRKDRIGGSGENAKQYGYVVSKFLVE